MNYLTNYYKNLSEQLQERVNNITKLLNEVKSQRQLVSDTWHNHPTSSSLDFLRGRSFPTATTDSEVGEQMMQISPEEYHRIPAQDKGSFYNKVRETPADWSNKDNDYRTNADFGEQDLDLEIKKANIDSSNRPVQWSAINRPQQEMIHAIDMSKAAEGRANARQRQMTPAQRELEQAAMNPSGAKTLVPWSGQVKQKIDALKQKGN
jgi:hypothetical protein